MAPEAAIVRHMTLISLLVTLVLVGIALYVVNTLVPMDAKIKQIINVIVVVAVVLWLLNVFFGVGFGNLGSVRVGHTR